MESWRLVWRDGFVPVLSTECLTALRDALRDDDPRLIQRATSCPPPLSGVQERPCEAGCALGYMGAFAAGGFGVATVADAEEFFARACFEADQRLGEPAACRWFLDWFDRESRDELRRELLPEVERAIAERSASAA